MKLNNIKKEILFFGVTIIFTTNVYSQSFNDEKVSLMNFIKCIHTSIPFEELKLVNDVSVISLKNAKYVSKSTLNSAALIKS